MDKGKTEFIRFDPWYFNSTEQLLQTFFEEINRALKDKVTGKNFEKALSKYRRSLSSIAISPKVSLWGIELSLGSIDIDLENPDKLRNEIKKLIEDTKTRVIVLVDNLDRLDISELLLLLKLVRLCSDFPGFTFVLAFDKGQVLKLLEENKISPDFLEKIVQVDVKLPQVEQFRIDNFVSNGLIWIERYKKINLDTFFWSRFSQIYRSLVGPKLITTLRTAKRFLNTADFSLPIVRGEVDYADFLILQVIRIFFTEAYEILGNYKDELTKLEILGAGYEWRKKEKIAVFGELSEWIQTKYENDEAKILSEMLGFLFPNFQGYLQNPQNPSSQSFTREYEKYQLISASTHFDRYFTLKISVDDIPTTLIVEFIQRFNEEPSREIVQQQFFDKYRETENLHSAFSKIDLYLDKINDEAKLIFIEAILEDLNNFSPVVRAWRSELDLAARVVMNIVVTLPQDQHFGLINNAIISASSLRCSLYIAQDSILGREFSFTDEQRRALLEVYRERLHKNLLDEKGNVFELYPIGFGHILGSWRNEKFLNEDAEAKEYIKTLLDENPKYVIKILEMFIWVTAGTDKPADFGYGDLKKSYDPAMLKEYLDKFDWEKQSLTERETFAVKEFIRFYQKQEFKDLMKKFTEFTLKKPFWITWHHLAGKSRLALRSLLVNPSPTVPNATMCCCHVS